MSIRTAMREVVRAWLDRNVEAEIAEPETVLQHMREDRGAAMAEIIAQAQLPTATNAYLCMDCSLIQARPTQARCVLCGSEEVVNLAFQLQKGTTRIENVAARKVARRRTETHPSRAAPKP